MYLSIVPGSVQCSSDHELNGYSINFTSKPYTQTRKSMPPIWSLSYLTKIGDHAGPVTNTRLNLELTVHSTSSLPSWGALLTENTGISLVAHGDLTESGRLNLSTGSICDRVLCGLYQTDNTGCSISGEDSFGTGGYHGESSSAHTNERITHDICGTRAVFSYNDPHRCACCLGKNVIPCERTTTARCPGIEDLAQIHL